MKNENKAILALNPNWSISRSIESPNRCYALIPSDVVLREPRLTSNEKVLIGLLIGYGDFSRPSKARLAACMGATEQQVSQALETLRDRNVISWTRPSTKKGAVNHYEVHSPETWQLGGTTETPAPSPVVRDIKSARPKISPKDKPLKDYLRHAKHRPVKSYLRGAK